MLLESIAKLLDGSGMSHEAPLLSGRWQWRGGGGCSLWIWPQDSYRATDATVIVTNLESPQANVGNTLLLALNPSNWYSVMLCL